MRLFAAIFTALSMMTTCALMAGPECSCTNCPCTEEADCGCKSGKGCNCTNGGGCGIEESEEDK